MRTAGRPLLTWLLRRHAAESLAVSALAAVACTLVSGSLATPQLRGPSVALGSMVVYAIVLGCAMALPVRAADRDLELTSTRPVTWLRSALALLLLAANVALVAAVGTVTGAGTEQTLAAVRTMALVGGIVALVTRAASFVAAASLLLAYLGCVLFAGAGPDGSVDWWAHILAAWDPPVDGWLTLAGTVLVL